MKLIVRKNIDTSRWNNLVQTCLQGLPYAYTHFLDLVTDGKWEALIDDENNWAMPLPYNRKLIGLKQYYQPFFCQQLGIIGKTMPTREQQSEILKILRRRSVRAYVQLNENNSGLYLLTTETKTNLVLPLQDNYEFLSQSYNDNLRRKLKKIPTELHIEYSSDMDLFAQLYFTHTMGKVDEKISLKNIKSFLHGMMENKWGEIILCKHENKAICGGLFYLKTNCRLITIMPFTNEEYGKLPVQPLILDHIIRTYANTPFLLDFEGSSLPGVAQFYKSFGAIERNFPSLKF